MHSVIYCQLSESIECAKTYQTMLLQWISAFLVCSDRVLIELDHATELGEGYAEDRSLFFFLFSKTSFTINELGIIYRFILMNSLWTQITVKMGLVISVIGWLFDSTHLIDGYFWIELYCLCFILFYFLF